MHCRRLKSYAGTSADCNGDYTPDECQADCNDNDIPDDCDIAAETSLDRNKNGFPDECETDCNGNLVPDSFEIASNPAKDCNDNGVPDTCDVFAGTSRDCNANLIPDICDVGVGLGRDCNGNGIPDECDIASWPGSDSNGNEILDECDSEVCRLLWDGFPESSGGLPEPFWVNQLVDELDYYPGGSAWSNPSNSARLDAYGCESGDFSEDDLTLAVYPPDASADPEQDRHVDSEYFRTVDGELDCGATVHKLSFMPMVAGAQSMWDWEFVIYDARVRDALAEPEPDDGAVIHIVFASTDSDKGHPGHLMVKNPESIIPPYISTGIALSAYVCYEIDVVLDNRDGTVQLYVNGAAAFDSPLTALDDDSSRMDYFRVGCSWIPTGAGTTTSFRVDGFNYCVTAPTLVDWPDCDSNCLDDAADLSNGLADDCNSNGVPDHCDITAGDSLDVNPIDGTPDECQSPRASLVPGACAPPPNGSLWRTGGNTLRLTFGGAITLPDAGQLRIERLAIDGSYAEDVSADFAFAVENENVLRIRETTPCLLDRAWYVIRNLGDWQGAEPFEISYLMLVGDVNNDGRVKNLDASAVYANVSDAPVADNCRFDVDGNGFVRNLDASAVLGHVTLQPPPPKPSIP